MGAYRTNLRRFGAFVYMTAVAALPFYRFFCLEYPFFPDIFQQFQYFALVTNILLLWKKS